MTTAPKHPSDPFLDVDANGDPQTNSPHTKALVRAKSAAARGRREGIRNILVARARKLLIEAKRARKAISLVRLAKRRRGRRETDQS